MFEIVKSLRQSKGWSQKKAAIEIEISASYLSQIENGYFKPSYAVTQRICEVFDVSMAEFYQKAEFTNRNTFNSGKKRNPVPAQLCVGISK